MQASWLWLATLIVALTFYVHTFIGGPRVAGPLLADESLPKASKWLNYYCWHITTVMLLAMTFAYAIVAAGYAARDLTNFLGLLAGALGLLSIAVARKGEINPLRFPSTTLFLGIAATTAIDWAIGR